MVETDGAIEVSIELPGMEMKDIEVTVTDDMLTVRGEKKIERQEEKKGYYLSERSYGAIYRAIPLPPGVDADKARGVLQERRADRPPAPEPRGAGQGEAGRGEGRLSPRPIAPAPGAPCPGRRARAVWRGGPGGRILGGGLADARQHAPARTGRAMAGAEPLREVRAESSLFVLSRPSSRSIVAAALWSLLREVVVPLVLGAFDPLDHATFQVVFGMIFTVVIALEFKRSLLVAADRSFGILQVRTIVLIALLAIARKFIILDLGETESAKIAALAGAALALGVVFWLVREQDRREADALAARDETGLRP
ncbi:MAG: hypothetical protein KatS3mg118_2675 [Paracoccaceae bacterium]|nr:MAG: hypothetical protein KatS3mg118_2675 [Paracoccaceae bacterium]